jgi:lipopolysaccharide/colanic/teichoic acid biosynthesis glycosyltransferase
MDKSAESRLEELQDQNETDGPLIKMKNDVRVTTVEWFIRKHSIDEMPQFINCWLGQMATCGPRPSFLHEVEHCSKQDMFRLIVKPSLTGYWQMHDRSNTDFDEMVQLDMRYIEERSVLTDIKVVLKAIAVAFTGKDAWWAWRCLCGSHWLGMLRKLSRQTRNYTNG